MTRKAPDHGFLLAVIGGKVDVEVRGLDLGECLS